MVFNPKNLQAAPQIVDIDGEDPRALAVAPDGETVYAAIFESGNASPALMGGLDIDDDDLRELGQIIPENIVSNPNTPHGGENPPPNAGAGFKPARGSHLPAPPPVALIVKKNARGRWMDDNGASGRAGSATKASPCPTATPRGV